MPAYEDAHLHIEQPQETINLLREELKEYEGVVQVWRRRTYEEEAQANILADRLRRLVELKDGPRDDRYRAAKDDAWDKARLRLREFDESRPN